MKHRLTLLSGVHPMNDNVVGVFNDERTAFLVGDLLLALDKNDHPEYSDKEIAAHPDEADMPPLVRVEQGPLRIEHVEVRPGMHAIQVHGEVRPNTTWRQKGWLVEWKMKGGHTAHCYMITEPDPRNFKGEATITRLFELISIGEDHVESVPSQA